MNLCNWKRVLYLFIGSEKIVDGLREDLQKHVANKENDNDFIDTKIVLRLWIDILNEMGFEFFCTKEQLVV